MENQHNREEVSPHQLDQNMKAETIATDELTWHSPLDEPFRVSGLAWFDSNRLYRRLPAVPDHPISPAVDVLADCTSGGQIRFRTNSRYISVRVRLTAGSGMYHMPPTGECGVDAYTGGPGNWLFAGTANFTPGQLEYESRLFVNDSRQWRSYMLNLPLYQGVKEMWIGLDSEAEISPPESYDSDKKIVLYGTSITQGGCASRPGMSYTNILSRRMDREFINLGFSGNGKGEPELAHLSAQIENPACLVLDYEANCVSTEQYKKTLPAFIQIYREVHPDVPIILVSRFPYSAEAFMPELSQEREERRDFQADLIQRLTDAGDHKLTFVDGTNLLGSCHPAEVTVDGVHPTDLGFMKMADYLEPIIKQVLADGELA